MGEFDGRGPGGIEHGRTDRRKIVGDAPQRRVVCLIHRVMEIVAHQLQLGIDGVVDAYYVFADIGGLWDGRNVLGCTKVRMREGARVHFEDRIRIDQLFRNNVVGKWLVRGQAAQGIDCQLGWVSRGRNDWGRSVGWDGVYQILSGYWKITGGDSSARRRRRSLNKFSPLFIHKEERPGARVVVYMRDPEGTADIAAEVVQAEF